METQISRAKLRSWINRQRTRPTPSKVYLAWLHRQYRLTCEVTVIKGEKK